MQARNRPVKDDSFININHLCASGRVRDAIRTAETLHRQGIRVPIHVLFHLLKSCISEPDLTTGRVLHSLILNTGLGNNAFLACHLIRMFSSCQSLFDAKQTFINLPTHLHTVHIWNSIISAHVKHGHCEDAIVLYHDMCKSGFQLDRHTFVATLKACSNTSTIKRGRMIHSDIIKCGFELDLLICNTLVAMYIKSGSIADAHLTFISIQEKDVVTWNALISGYAHHGHGLKALHLLMDMYRDGCEPTHVTYLCLVRACSSTLALREGRLIHGLIVKNCLEQERFMGSSLIDMYAKCENVKDARTVFDNLQTRDVAAWNTIIQAFAQQACFSKSALLHYGELVHVQIVENGFESDKLIESTLIELYAKCYSMDDARGVFTRTSKQSVHAWNMLLSGYVHCEQIQIGLEVFANMQQDMIQPNETTIISALQACSSLEVHEPIMLLNDLIIRRKFEQDVFVMSALVNVYAKHGSLAEALSIFINIPKPGVITWTGLISGHVQHRNGLQALQLFYQMQSLGIEPNEATFVCAVKACIILESMEQGNLVHDCSIRKGLVLNKVIGSALINFYLTCGSLEDAFKVFFKLPNRDMVVWNVIIAGFVRSNDYETAIQYFEEMQLVGVQPDLVNFVSVLAGCSHLGLINEGHLSKAEDLLQALPSSYSSLGWKSLLGHCQTHCDLQLGRRCYDRLVELGLADASAWKLMLNIYSRAGMKVNAEAVEELRPAKGSVKMQRMHGHGWVWEQLLKHLTGRRLFLSWFMQQTEKLFDPHDGGGKGSLRWKQLQPVWLLEVGQYVKAKWTHHEGSQQLVFTKQHTHTFWKICEIVAEGQLLDSESPFLRWFHATYFRIEGDC
ncbi:hypothetical protein GOP47_0011784 [Adiantum capillus-veneris]|uniref:Pentatricopeptide repeat-containing protein n=1 Tax=Adiantum capillus-veneris TaxID=13818 RepID=A0A9D4UTX1_ADICA|nr:hypothetical protein GOP47_0011784 [Adiantum capillus-veneris]